MKNATAEVQAMELVVGQVLAEVDGEPLRRGPLGRLYCRIRNRRLVDGYPVITRAEYTHNGEDGLPTTYVESSEAPGYTWCLEPREIVKVVRT